MTGVFVLYGKQGSLKTSITTTWPGLVRLYDFDLGAHRAWGIEKLMATNVVEVVKIRMPEKSLTSRHESMQGYSEAWMRFLELYLADCRSPAVKTIVLDTATVLWTLIQDAYLQEIQWAKPDRKQLLQVEFGEPNRRMKQVVDTAKNAEKNLFLVSHESQEYATVTYMGKPLLDENGQVKSSATGKQVPEGFKAIRDFADWVLRTTLDDDEKNPGRVIPSVVVEKSARGIDLMGTKLTWFDYAKFTGWLAAVQR